LIFYSTQESDEERANSEPPEKSKTAIAAKRTPGKNESFDDLEELEKQRKMLLQQLAAHQPNQ